MKTSWTIGFFFVWVITHLTCSTLENSNIGGDMATFDSIFTVEWAAVSNPLQGIWAAAVIGWNLISAFFGALLFLNYTTIFQGDWEWFRTIFLWPITVAMFWGIIKELRGSWGAG